ncbi:MAG: transcriptional repressor LexA, partial [Planctomycetia bacterium]
MAAKVKLTSRQHEVYDFIREKIQTRGYGPTVREIGAEFEIRSPNGVMCHLQALVKKGLIVREKNMSRAITIVADEEDFPRLSPTAMPLYGSVAAGLPIETFQHQEEIDFGPMLFDRKGCFALKVRGQSMIDDHINEGDFVIVHGQETAKDGQIVVA